MKGKILILILSFVFFFTGCNVNKTVCEESDDYPPISPFPKKNIHNITLYFPNKNLDYLVPEIRKVDVRNQPIEKIIIEELLKGTHNEQLTNLIPSETRLISTDIIGKIMYLNFSKELIREDLSEKEEALVLYSIINSAAQVENVDEVQILIEGETREVFYKYFTIDKPKKTSSLIINNAYVSPISTVMEYYNNIINQDYIGVIDLFHISESENKNYYALESYFQDYYGNISKYLIKEYKISNYDKFVSVYVVLELFYNNNMDKKVQEQEFILILEDNKFEINEILNKNFFMNIK
ncbi:GerMN domain-containing protein [Caloranaerobacter azorensis]|uniref:GerMN domain-containing protein n=1 Tax=Caloranaerobacter azorensis TaxID=116090 RepID=A0A6P1YER6_9FIRM|nr:GerMN domain-containing protein [Caloranaerobacter azorensis]QIB26635.1 GerMN domain-containing protein [Caloranaerobacter azorensis]